MATENLGKCVTFEAGQDLSAKQYYFVVQATDKQVDPSGDGVDADGVLQNDPSAAGQAAEVMVGTGITKITAGAAFSVNDNLASNSSGQAIKAATGDYILGKALEAATASGQQVTMLYRRRSSVAP